MKEEIEVKRKVFAVEEQIGEHSYKVERKGQLFFLKKFEDNEKEFEAFCDAEHRLRVSGVINPKCIVYDKKTRIAVTEYIEGNNCLEELLKGDLPEVVIEQLFKAFWYARNDLMALDYKLVKSPSRRCWERIMRKARRWIRGSPKIFSAARLSM